MRKVVAFKSGLSEGLLHGLADFFPQSYECWGWWRQSEVQIVSWEKIIKIENLGLLMRDGQIQEFYFGRSARWDGLTTEPNCKNSNDSQQQNSASDL